MSIYDLKEVCLRIRVKDNISDPRYLEFMKNWDFTKKEVADFIASVFGTEYTPMADKIITFICEYKDGTLIPDKWGLWEPLKYVFDVSEKNKYISKIAFPRGELYMLKKRRFDITIQNRYWDPSPGRPSGKLPEYLCLVSIWFRKLKKLDYIFLKTLLQNFCDYLGTDQGIMFDAETDEILLDISNPERIGTHIVDKDPFVQT